MVFELRSMAGQTLDGLGYFVKWLIYLYKYNFCYSGTHLLVLLSQSVAAFAEKNHIFEKTHFLAWGGLRWVCKDRGTWRRGFRRLLMV